MQERSDETLMKAYAQGDTEAFEHLYSRHRAPLYRYILRQVGDVATANDLYQGSWEKIIRARTKYRAAVPFRAWMYRIAHNHVMDHFRRIKPVADLPAESLASADAGPDEQFLQETREDALRTAMSRLPAEQREALSFKLDSGLDLQTIADITGVNRETVKSRLRYAVTKLKRTLGDLNTG
ncbi:MAG: sigma-70 family RNA polymerase sigma factor [Xanthomonadales bacterium]|nr:sigma-70 family RNA polymerase sigma factor [Gammaproteobacteria bacterium]MBT8053245.1 sigma-70 family RNA polymerase sigma factor [Gammaproteobacteria bacterium]NNK50285.1 sigma-70 family RNA polymerase sigma factor [Xanthomonadales bacterium]